ncbi:LTA synthase family protein [Gorillibacterium massiliense]|uniref:LTA synthase family protein n=1 Tax=Gorillibacterium massiliense TaxID=1280390 RepID=UPI0005928913|nr:LTA synthase family protein [Gorillibacterium massiliense]
MSGVSILKRIVSKWFFLFTVILLLKGALAWFVVFDNGASYMTLVTEIPFLWIVFCLIEWFARKRKLLYYNIVNLLFTLLYFTVLMYYKYYGIIVTYHALSQADKVTKVGESTYSLLDPYYLLIFVDIIIFAAILVWARIKKDHRLLQVKPLRKSVVTFLFVLSIVLCLFNVLPNRASMNENKKAEEMGILNYEAYTIFSDSKGDDPVVEMKDITQDAINNLKGVQKVENPKYFGAAKGKNVIIIQMESMQNFLIGLTVNGQVITPNMNKLAAENFHYNRFYTMVGQGTTSDAEYVVNTSLYVPKHEAATDHTVEKALPSLPKLMSANGYTTATFHTNAVEFWNRSELYTAVGWDKFYDQTFFGDEDHIAFGASDEVLYTKTLPELVKMDQEDRPFYAQVISMSSHHPFHIPDSKVRIELPKEFDNTLVGNYIKAQNYSDYALGKFIDDLKSSGLWDDSIVLLYGDHQGLPLYSLDKNEKQLMDEMLGHEYGYTDMFNIPLVLHIPGVTYPAELEQTGGQIDILPTVANLVGASLDNQIHFGEDLLNQSTNLLPMRHFLPSGSFLSDTELFLPGIDFSDGSHYPLHASSSDTGTLNPANEDEYNRMLKLLNLSDSYVKQLPDKTTSK